MLHHHYYQLQSNFIPHSFTRRGTTLTFLHGDTLDSRQWQPQVDYFKSKYNLLTYDLHGYGQNPYPNEPYSHVADLNELLTQLNISKTHLIGSSFGGEQAINFTLTHPDKVLSLTLIDSSLSGFPCDVNWNVGADKTRWLKHPVFAPTKKFPLAVQSLLAMVGDYNRHYWLNPELCQKLTPAAINRLSEINCSVLLIVGEHDLSYFHSIAKYIQSKLRNSATPPLRNFRIISNSGHLPALEQPSTTNYLINNFIKNISNLSG